MNTHSLTTTAITWLRQSRLRAVGWREGAWAWLKAHGGALVELGLIGLWAAWVGRAYLDFNPFMWPLGREIGAQLNNHYFWIQLQRCGLCALWDGTINGGMPALADPFGSKLHPLVMVTTLLWGVIGGAKVALVVSFWFAGVAQWWIAHTLKLGRVARLWSALLATVGGHLTARMASGEFGIILSIATCSLALAAALELGVTGQRRSMLLLALIGGLALLAGQGYMQLGLLGWIPAFLFLLLDDNLRLRFVWREYALAIGLSLLLAGVFLIPMFHFLPNFAKDVDPSFSQVQPLEYFPLNFVIRDVAFMQTAILGKNAAPELFTMYIGWVPILLAVLPLRFARREDHRVLWCLTAGVVMSFLLASAIPLKWWGDLIPFLQGFRHASLIGALAVPAILGLAAYGLNGLLKLDWPQVTFALRKDSSKTFIFSLAWILLVPLLWSLRTAYDLSFAFIKTQDAHLYYQLYEKVASDLKSPGLQWVSPPFGEHFLVEPAIHTGFKLTEVVPPSKWANRDYPQPEVVISRSGDYPGAERVSSLGNDIPVYLYPDRAYAYVDLGDQQVPCLATGSGGDLTVRCSTDQAGKLIIQEYSWTGWGVQRDGASVPLQSSAWLSADAPPGQHTYEFRYRPWDAAVGLALTLVGLSLIVWLWFRPSLSFPLAQSSSLL